MFIAYTDASVQNDRTYLAFVIVFEDKSTIYRRISVDETNNNKAEIMAYFELVAFLKYYKVEKGTILFDSNYVKSHLKRKRTKLIQYIAKKIKTLQITTQVISRK